MRSTPGRPYPLIIPLSAGPGKTQFLKIVFSHKDFTSFIQFSHMARGCVAPAAVPLLAGPWGPQKQVPKKNSAPPARARIFSGAQGTLTGLISPPRRPVEFLKKTNTNTEHSGGAVFLSRTPVSIKKQTVLFLGGKGPGRGAGAP